MKILFLVTLFVVLAVVNSRPETYGDEFDSLDVDDLLTHPRLVDNYIYCIKTGQKCTAEGLRAREIVPDALKTECSKCTDKQKKNALKILEWAIINKSDDFLEIEAQYDPEREFRKHYADELKARNINLPAIK